jgi:4-amino-4-deoxy-L-arabinose transferase-like glycosyltransferase
LTPPLPRRAALALLAPAALVWIGTVANKALDPDESQHLQAAWLVGQGRVPFAEFWEHHSPLLYYLLAPLTRAFAESPAVYFAGRTLMVVTAVVALGLVYRLGRRLSTGTALAAVALLAFLPRFVELTVEVRPDGPALVFSLAAFLAIVRWQESGRPGWLWAAGLALGVAVAFTPKAVYEAPGVAAVLLAVEWRRGRDPVGRVLTGWARLAAGAAVPLLALFGGLWLHGGSAALYGFREHVLASALEFADFTKEAPVSEEGFGFLALAVVGLAIVVRREGRTLLDHPVHPAVLAPVLAATVALLLPTTPAVYRHAWLPVVAGAAVYAGHALAAALAGPRVVAALAVLIGLVGPATVSIQTAVVNRNAGQLDVVRQLLARTCQGEPVLDGTALAVFRPAAYRYRVLIRGIRKWIAEGKIPEERFVDDAREARPRVAYPDIRLKALVGPMKDFLRRHYVAMPGGLLVAGAAIRETPPGGGGRASVDLLHGETYRLTASPALRVSIDGEPVPPGLARLTAGRHEVTWTGPVGSIELTTLACAERKALGALLAPESRGTVTSRLPARAILAPPPPA